MMDVKLIRLITGEEIVAEVLDWQNGILTIQNALVVIPQQGQVTLKDPWATVIDNDQPEIALGHETCYLFCCCVHHQSLSSMLKSLVATSSFPRKKLIV